MKSRQSRYLTGVSLSALVGTAIALGAIATATPAVADTPSPSTTAPASASTPQSSADQAQAAQVKQILQSAQRAINDGKVDLAVIELKNAVRLVPTDGQVRGDLGLVLQRTGDNTQAERELRQALQDGGPKKRLLPSLMNVMLLLREYKTVLDEFPDPADSDESAVEILRARGNAYQALGKSDDAKVAIDRALKLRRDAPGLLARARIALEQRDIPLAESLTEEAIALNLKDNPKDLSGQVLQVEVRRQSGDKTGALALADALLQKDPNNTITQITRISLLIDLDRTDDAQKAVDAILAKTSDLPPAVYFKAVLQAKAKNFADSWRTAQTLPPEFVQADPSISVTVASMAADSGNLESANTILAALIAGHPAIDTQAMISARTLSAFVFLRLNKPQDALNVLKPVDDSKNPMIVGLLAQASMGLRHFDEAVRYLQNADAGSGNDATLQQELAVSQLASGNVDQGLQQLNALFEKDPTNPVYAGLLIGFLSRTLHWTEAYAAVDKMEAKDPKSPLPVYYRGQLLTQQNKYPDAVASFTTSIARDPKFLAGRYGRALALVDEGNLPGAETDLNEILKQDPKNLSALIKKADIAAGQGKPDDAIVILNGAISALPKDPKPRFALASYLLQINRLDDALAASKTLTQLFPDDVNAINLLGTVQQAKGQKEEAVQTFRSLVERAPASVQAKLKLANSLALNNNQDEAISLLQKTIAANPTDITARKGMIALRLIGKQNDVAVQVANDYRKQTPGVAAELLVADTLAAAGRMNDAITSLTAAVPAGNTDIVIRLCQFETVSGGKDKAQVVAADWLKSHTNDIVVRRYYAGALMDVGKIPEARDQYEQILKDSPTDTIALNNLGWLIQKDQPDRAIALVSEAYKTSPNAPDVVDTLGWLKFKHGEQKDALQLLDKAHGLTKDDPTISYHFAVALQSSGDKAKAKQMVQEALASKKTFADADAAKTLAASLQ